MIPLKQTVQIYSSALYHGGGILFIDSNNNQLFSMDLDVNRPVADLRLYTIKDSTFHGPIPEQMLADKITSLSSVKIFRRVKD